MAAAMLAACVVPAVDNGREPAAVATVGVASGYHLGPPSVSGAAGTFGFEVPVYPANPHQVCSVTVTVQASIAPIAGGRYANVAASRSTRTVTLAFTGNPLPLGVLWLWSPHCADPSAPRVFPMTSGGQLSSIPLAAMFCAGFAGGSSLLFAGLDPADTSTVVGMAATTTGQGYWTVRASGWSRGRATPWCRASCPCSTDWRSEWSRTRSGRGTGSLRLTAGCSPSGMPVFTVRWAACVSMRRWWRWRPRPMVAATGWWGPTAGCSPSGMPVSRLARWRASQGANGGDGGHSRWSRLLARCL